MGAMLKIVALINGKTSECSVELDCVDIVQCNYHKDSDDIIEVGRRGKLIIDTTSSNRISIDTGVQGKILCILADTKLEAPIYYKGIDGVLKMYTGWKLYSRSKENFLQYILGKGGFVPSKQNDDTDNKSEKS